MKHVAQYRPVAFRDSSTGDVMVIRSTVETTKTIEHDGRTLPLYDLEVSSHSHPAFTGRVARPEASDGIKKFRHRYGISANKFAN